MFCIVAGRLCFHFRGKGAVGPGDRSVVDDIARRLLLRVKASWSERGGVMGGTWGVVMRSTRSGDIFWVVRRGREWTYDDTVATGQDMIAGGQSKYSWLGEALAPMGGAAYKGDNCDTFARSSYAKLLLPAPAGGPTSCRHILKRLVSLKRWVSEQLSVYLY